MSDPVELDKPPAVSETVAPQGEQPESSTVDGPGVESIENNAGNVSTVHSEQNESMVDEASNVSTVDGLKDESTVDDGDVVAVGTQLPDLTEDAALVSALESLLLVVDSPATEQLLAAALEQPVDRVATALRALAERYTDSGSGIDLRRVGDGWRFYTRDVYAPYVEKLLLDGQRAKLTRAALETLAVIAYRQPVTRARVAAVRGVNVDGVVRTLLARGLIEEVGVDADTQGTLYRTTELFLERLGLSTVDDLPPLAPLLPEVDSIDDI